MESTPRIELIYDPDCPNVERARERLRHAIAERGQDFGCLIRIEVRRELRVRHRPVEGLNTLQCAQIGQTGMAAVQHADLGFLG